MFFLELQWNYRLPWGTQGASCVAAGKSNIHSRGKGELGMALESLQGK